MKIGILTDSTADLTQSLISKYNIEVVPLSVHFNNDVYKDGIELTSDQFFNKIRTADKLPKTSQPTTASLLNKYKEMSKKYDSIISIHLSAGLSSTYKAVKNISQQYPDYNIYPFDSASISLGLGFQTIMAAKLSKKLDSAEDIIKIIKKAKQNLILYFTVNDLTYMKKGGRIGKAKALLGNILNINPIISISTATGRVKPLYNSRGKKRTMDKMISTAVKKINNDKFAWLGFAHGDRKDDMLRFENSLLNLINKQITHEFNYQVFESRISSTLGCHVGPSVYAGFILSGDFLENIM